MSEWKEYKIADIISLEYGKSLLNYRNSTGEYDVFGTNGKIGTSDEFLYDNPSVIIGRKGAYREVHLSKKPFFVIDTAFYTKNKITELDTFFLFYWFKNIDINAMDSGSAIPSTSRDEVYDIDIKLPPLSEQIQITNILSSLDDKIDLLQRQNKTLEQLAETLFQQWFLEQTEVSWEFGRLGDILKSIESGSRPKGGIDPTLKEGIPSIGAENINGLGVYDFSKTKFITHDFFKSMNRGVINDYDVLVYKDGAYVGRKGMFAKAFPYDICTVNEHVFILRTNDRANQFFLYFLLQQDVLAQLNTNTAQPGLNQDSMKSLEIIIPPIEIINRFEENIKTLIDKIFFNCNQIRSLSQLRDTLLPKLMSGEVRVKM